MMHREPIIIWSFIIGGIGERQFAALDRRPDLTPDAYIALGI